MNMKKKHQMNIEKIDRRESEWRKKNRLHHTPINQNSVPNFSVFWWCDCVAHDIWCAGGCCIMCNVAALFIGWTISSWWFVLLLVKSTAVVMHSVYFVAPRPEWLLLHQYYTAYNIIRNKCMARMHPHRVWSDWVTESERAYTKHEILCYFRTY